MAVVVICRLPRELLVALVCLAGGSVSGRRVVSAGVGGVGLIVVFSGEISSQVWA